jgi:hypothetical protein
MVFPFFFALVALHDLDSPPTIGASARLGIWVGVAFRASEYYGLFLLVVVVVGTPLVLGLRLRERIVAGSVLAAIGCLALLAAPMLLPQLTRTYSDRRMVVYRLSASARVRG